jgi:mannose-6-phosphate isomerase-like protein (cupin superfamily)
MQITDIIRPRRIVTGQSADGKSRIGRFEDVDHADYPYVLPGSPSQKQTPNTHDGYYRIWGSDQLPVPLPNNGTVPVVDSEPTEDETVAMLQRMDACPPPLGMRVAWMSGAGDESPGEMHWHDSTEIFFVMCGERGQILDSGEEHVLHAGDVQVQHGTHHAHQSLGDEPCIIGNVGVGGLRVGPYPPVESLHPVQRGWVGGHRSGERRDKQPMGAWTTTKPAGGAYPGMRGLRRIEDVAAPRRVIIGQNAEGRAYVAHAEEARPARPGPDGATYWPIWGTDRLPMLLPTLAAAPVLEDVPLGRELDGLAETVLVPPPLGYRAAVVRLDPTPEPGSVRRCDGLDVVFVMSGRLVLRLDSGEELDLQPGDCVVHNGTVYAWHNRFKSPAILGITAFGGFRRV